MAESEVREMAAAAAAAAAATAAEFEGDPRETLGPWEVPKIKK
jgi:hypothetical protein